MLFLVLLIFSTSDLLNIPLKLLLFNDFFLQNLDLLVRRLDFFGHFLFPLGFLLLFSQSQGPLNLLHLFDLGALLLLHREIGGLYIFEFLLLFISHGSDFFVVELHFGFDGLMSTEFLTK